MKKFAKFFAIFVLGAVFAGCKLSGNNEMVSVRISTKYSKNSARVIEELIGDYINEDLKYELIIQETGKTPVVDNTYASFDEFWDEAFGIGLGEIPAGIYDFTVNAFSDEAIVLTGTVSDVKATPDEEVYGYINVEITLNIAEQTEVTGNFSYELSWLKPTDEYYEIQFTLKNLDDKDAKSVVEKINAVAQNQAENKDDFFGLYLYEKELPKGTYSLEIDVIQYPYGVKGGVERHTKKYEPFFNVYPMMTTNGNYTFHKLNLSYAITYDCEVEYKVKSELYNSWTKEILLDPVTKPYHDFLGWFVVEQEVEEVNDDEIEEETSGAVISGGVTEEKLVEKFTSLDTIETATGKKYVFRPENYLTDVTIRAVFEQQVATPNLSVNLPEIANAKKLNAYWDEIFIDEETDEESVESVEISEFLEFNVEALEAEKEIYFTSDEETFDAEDYVWAWYKDGELCTETEDTNKFTINTATDVGAVDLVVTASIDGKIIYTGAISYFSYR